jgi:FAD/FMN-containing dehydrogenase
VGAVRTLFLDNVDYAVAETILEHIQASTAMMAVTQLRVLGGAMARVPVEATAFAHRRSRIMVNVAALYNQPEEKALHEAWAERFAAAIRQSDNGAYANFLGDEGEERVRAAYPGTTWERLAAIKAQYDPTNLFRLNQNIRPQGNGR